MQWTHKDTREAGIVQGMGIGKTVIVHGVGGQDRAIDGEEGDWDCLMNGKKA